jgi:hypothetical protein
MGGSIFNLHMTCVLLKNAVLADFFKEVDLVLKEVKPK